MAGLRVVVDAEAVSGEDSRVTPDQPGQPDHVQRTLADLDARLGRIAAEVADMRAGLAELGRGPVQQPGFQPEPQPYRAPERSTVWRPGQQVQPGYASGQQSPQPVHAPQPRPDRPWAPPAEAAGQRERRVPRITAATVIAAIGGTVMLAGVVFLLVAAIQAGLFPPLARVLAAGALAVVLVGLGMRLQARHEIAARDRVVDDEKAVNPGALALVGTGFATAILTVIASATLYHWIPVPAAYMFVGALALAGMVLAQRWSSPLLATFVSAGTMVLSPLISHGVELPVFLVILGIATAVLGAGLGNAVRVVWSVIPSLMLMGYLGQADVRGKGDLVALLVAALAFAAAGGAIAWYDSMRREPALANAGLVVVPTAFPLVAVPTIPFLDPGWPVALVLAALYLAAAYLAGLRTVGHRAQEPAPLLLSAVTGAVGSVLLLTGWIHLGGQAQTSLAVTLSAIAYLLAAGLWRRSWLDWLAGIGAVIAVVLYLSANQPFLALSQNEAIREFTGTDVIASIFVTALAVVATWWATHRFPHESARVLIAGAVTALLAGSAAVVAFGVVIGEAVEQARDGFLVAHLVVTVLWTCCAAWLVLTPRPRLARAQRLGFVLGALALAKLLILDLATLPGLFRVLSFIVVGAVMLAVAVRYRSETDPSGSGSPT